MNRTQLVRSLNKYKSHFSEEVSFIKHFITLLESSRAYFRDHLPGHITGSAWIVDESRENILLTHHAKLNRWLQPGGHADGDEDIIKIALKEAQEETGLNTIRVLGNGIFDIDIHSIPERDSFPEHFHYDIRILVEASKNELFKITPESHALRWVPLEGIANISKENRSMIRMTEKVRRLFTADQK
jgi:8-oxo-dGTP pyrophosphatase MutT (NUDIX family)